MDDDDTMERPIYCKKCLLRDMDIETCYKGIREYVFNLDVDLKADPTEYERRLGICKECDNLLSGTCRICGCFVEMRAALKLRNCPDVERFW